MNLQRIPWIVLVALALTPIHTIAKQPKSPRLIQDVADLDYTKVHNVGNIRCLITNFGIVGSAPGSTFPFQAAPSAEWPAGSGTEYLWIAGPWVGAIKSGEPAVTTTAYQIEVRPGTTPLDIVYETHEGAANGNRSPWPDADDDNDGAVDEDWLDGRDNDGDALIDEDFAAISNQMFFSEFNDADPIILQSLPEHEPLGLVIQQSSMVWQHPNRDDIIGFDFQITNASFDILDDVHFGFFADCDIGRRENPSSAVDDWAGFWEGIRIARFGNTTRNVKISIGYMFDDDGDQGASEGYIGFVFLGAEEHGSPGQSLAQLRNFRMFSGTVPFEQGGDPTSDEERYEVLNGTAPMSLGPPNPVTGLRPPLLASRKDDYRLALSLGPFGILEPADTLSVQLALVIGRGFDEMLENAVAAQLLYDGLWFDCDGDPETGVLGREQPVCGPDLGGQVFRIDPCDAMCEFSPPSDPDCYVVVPDSGCAWINADCALEDFLGFRTGIDGKECNVRWLADTTVPVQLSDFSASVGTEHVLLAWRFPLAALQEIRAVRVQRADSPAGPFENLDPIDQAPFESMSFEDLDVPRGQDYWYRLVLLMSDGSQETTRIIRVTTSGESTSEPQLRVVSAGHAAPVEIRYRIGASGAEVRLQVVDVKGRLVLSLDEGIRERGEHVRVWDRRNAQGQKVAHGVYLVELRAGNRRLSRKLVLAGD